MAITRGNFRDRYNFPPASHLLNENSTQSMIEAPNATDWMDDYLPSQDEDITRHVTPSMWLSPEKLTQIFEDQERNSVNRDFARNNVTPEHAYRAREITGTYPFMKPGVVQSLVKSNAPDDVVQQAAKSASVQALRDGLFEPPNAINHLPYRSTKARSPVRVPQTGNTFEEMQTSLARRRREKMTREHASRQHGRALMNLSSDPGAHGKLTDRDRAESLDSNQPNRASGSPTRPGGLSGPPSAQGLTRSRYGDILDQAPLNRSDISERPDTSGFQTGGLKPREVVGQDVPELKNFMTPQDVGADPHRQLPLGPNTENRNKRLTLGGLDTARRFVLSGVQAAQTSFNQPDISFWDAFTQAEQGPMPAATIPALLDRVKDGTFDREDLENRNYLSLYLDLLSNPITPEEVDQYLQDESGDNWTPAGNTDITAWKASQEQAVRFAEDYYPDIAEAYRDEEDPYAVFASPGRIFARDVGISSPGERGFDFLSGAVDLMATIGLDPVGVGLGGSSRVSHAGRVFGKSITLPEALYPRITRGVRSIGERAGAGTLTSKIRQMGGFQGSRPLTIIEDATDQLTKTNHGQKTVEWLTGNKNAREIWRGFNKKIDFTTARELANADNANDVRGIFLNAAQGRSPSGGQLARRITQLPGAQGNITGPISRTFAGMIDPGNAGEALGMGTLFRHRGASPRFFARAPMQGAINIGRRANQGLENAERLLMNARVDKNTTDKLVNDFIQAEDAAGRQDVLNDIMGNVSARISGAKYRPDGYYKPIEGTLPDAQIKANRQFNEGVETLTRRMTSFYRDGGNEIRAFHIDPDTGLAATFPGSRNQQEETRAIAGMISEAMNENVPMPDWRQMRRETSWVGKALHNATPETLKAEQFYDTMIRALEVPFVKLWQPLQLFRAAWAMRVGIEEVVGRMANAGLAGLSNHPGSYIASALGGLPDYGGRAVKVKGPVSALRRASQVTQKHVGTYRASTLGRPFSETESVTMEEPLLEALNREQGAGEWRMLFSNESRSGNGGQWVGIRVRDEQTGNLLDNGVEAATIQLHRMANDRPMRRLAGDIPDGARDALPLRADGTRPPAGSFDEFIDMLWEGDLKPDRLAYARAHGKDKLANSDAEKYGYSTFQEAMANSKQFVRDHFADNQQKRLIQTSVVDDRLLDLVNGSRRVHFNYAGNEYSLQLSSIRPGKNPKHDAAWKAASQEVRDVYDEVGKDAPNWMAGPLDVANGNPAGTLGQNATKNMDRFTDSILKMTFIAPNNFMSRSPTFRQFVWKSAEENLELASHAVRRQILRNAKEANIPRAQLQRMRKIANETPEGHTFTETEHFSNFTMEDGVDRTKDLLYDVADRGQYADILRITNPFLEAFREVYRHWGKALANNPQYLPRAQQAYNSMRGVGAIYEDPQSGEDKFAYTGMGGMMQRLGLDPFYVETESDWDLRATGHAQGLNLIAQTILPSFGPVVTLPAQAMGLDKIEGEMGQLIRDVVFPFGEDDSIENAFIPAWMLNGYARLHSDPEASPVKASTLANVTRALASTGEYTVNEQGMFKGEEAAELQRDAERITNRLLLLRMGAQFFLPTGPSYEFKVENPRDASMYTIGEVSKEYHDLADEYDFDYERANEEFIDKFGWDFLSAAMPRSDRATSQAESMDHLFWRQDNREFVDAYPSVAMQLSPYAEPDNWDLEAFWQSDVGPDSIPLSPYQMGIIKNNIVGTQRMRQEEQRLRQYASKNIEDDAQEEFLRIMKSEMEGEIMRQYPGYKQSVEGTLEDLDITEQSAQLRRAVNDDNAPDEPVLEAVREYYDFRDEMSRMLNRELGLSMREDRGLLSSNQAAPFRDELEIWLRLKQREVPELGAIMTSVLLPELDIMSEEDRSERDAAVESGINLNRIYRETDLQFGEDVDPSELAPDRFGDLSPDAPIAGDEAANEPPPPGTTPTAPPPGPIPGVTESTGNTPDDAPDEDNPFNTPESWDW